MLSGRRSRRSSRIVAAALALGSAALLIGTAGAPADTGRPEPRAAAGRTAAAPRPPPPFELIVPAETADQGALDTLVDWRGMPVFGDAQYVQFDSHDRHTGAPPPMKLMANGNRDNNNFICVSADARFKTSYLVPYIFDLPSCPESYVRGFVAARAEGSGRLARFWLATLTMQMQNPGPKMIRVYVDDAPEPFIQVPVVKVSDGSAGEIFAPPFGAGTPDVVAWYYPVVFSTKLIIAVDSLGPLDMLIYHADIALDATQKPRVAAPARLAARDAAIALLGSRADGPGASAGSLLSPRDVSLAPGESVVLDLDGPATIAQARFRVAAAAVPALSDVRVSVRWDGGASPAIDHSLGMLLAAALDTPTQSSLALGSSTDGDDVLLALRLPMPFTESAEWTLANEGDAAVAFRIEITGDVGVPAAPWGYLHTEPNTTLAPATSKYHPVANVTGRGRYVGTCLMVEGHQLPPTTFLAEGFNYLEGRVRAEIDGVLRVPGTGTESYVNTGFYFNRGPYGTPFAHGWGMAKFDVAVPFRPPMEHGKVSACRWHVLGDVIDFQSSLTVEYEIGPGDPSLLDRYRTVAFYYR